MMEMEDRGAIPKSFRAEWRAKLNEAKQRYEQDPTNENRLEYQKLLKLFADIVVRNAEPPESASEDQGKTD